MRFQVPSLPALHAFEAAARHESFAAAAQELNLSQATVSHRVRRLEVDLGHKLFHRNPRSLELTEMGKAYLPSVRKAFDDLSISTTGLFGPRGNRARSLSVTASVSFAVLWLAPRLDAFCDLYPGVDVRLKSSIWAEGPREEESDVEIRFGHGLWSGYHAEQISREVAVPVCSPEAYSAAGGIRGIEDLARCSLVHILSMEDLWQRLFRSANLVDDIAMEGVIVDSTVAALEMASSGNRFAIAPLSLVQPYLDAGRLVIALDSQVPVEPSHYLLSPVDSAASRPEALLFRDWLLATARQQAR